MKMRLLQVHHAFVLITTCCCFGLTLGGSISKDESTTAAPQRKITESKIHYIKLPAAKYQNVPGLGYIALPDTSIAESIVQRISSMKKTDDDKEGRRSARRVPSGIDYSLNEIEESDILRPNIKFHSNARPSISKPSYRNLDQNSLYAKKKYSHLLSKKPYLYNKYAGYPDYRDQHLNYRRIDSPSGGYGGLNPSYLKGLKESKKYNFKILPKQHETRRKRTKSSQIKIILPTRMNGLPTFLTHFQYPYAYKVV